MAKQEIRADLLLGRDTLSPGLIKAGEAASSASGNIKQLTRDLYEVSKQRATPVVDLQDAAAETKLKDVTAKLKELGAKAANPSVDVNDKQALADVAAMRVKLDALGAKVSSPRITLNGVARVEAQLLALDVQLDRLDAKRASPSLGGGAGGGLLGLGQSGMGSLGLPLAGGGIAGAGLVGAGLVPGVVGAGLGGAVGLGAIGGGLFGAQQGKTQLTADLANIKAITASLKTAIGQQQKDLHKSLLEAQKKFRKDAAFFQPFTDFADSLKGLAQTIIAPLRPIMEPLVGIIKEFGKGLTGLGPQFTALFRASLPFIRQFLQFMLQAGKILLPAFTQAMNQMVKSGALKQMTDALVVLTQGLATFIVNLGPGMAASAQIFARLMTFTGRMLGFLGDAFSAVAKFLASDWSPGHLWNVLLRSARAFFSAVIGSARAFWHAVVASFNALRHDVATVWDTIWRNTVTRVKNGIADVIGWFRNMPGRVLNAINGLGTSLYNFGHMALTKLWNGMKNVFGSVWNWFKSLPGKLLNAIGIHSPPDWAIQAGKHIMGGILHGITSRKQELMASVGNIRYKVGAGVAQWAPMVRRVLAMEGLSPLLAGRVLYQMQTESGGNPNAINLTDSNAAAGDPSRGLLQTIGSTFRAYHWPGTSWNIYNPLANIAAAVNYARHVYGPSLMSGGMGMGSGHGYDSGGWLPPGLSLALNRTGVPERVLSPAEMRRSPGSGTRVVLQIHPTGTSAFDRFMADWLSNAARVRGGGSLELAFGAHH